MTPAELPTRVPSDINAVTTAVGRASDIVNWSPLRCEQIVKALTFLPGVASRGDTVTYGELADEVGSTAQQVSSRVLDPAAFVCEREGWHPMGSLAVGARTRETGTGWTPNSNGPAAEDRAVIYRLYAVTA